jgi:hypothetical protein
MSYQLEIRNGEVAQELEKRHWTVLSSSPIGYSMVAPEALSNNKAKKIASSLINLMLAAKEVSRAQGKYARRLEELEEAEK